MSTLIPYLIRLDVYSHGIRVSRFNDTVRRALVEYCRRFASYGMVPTGRGQYESRITKVFAGATKPRDEYFFHRNSLDDLLNHLKYNQITEDRILRTDHPMYTPAVAEFGWEDEERQPRDFQLDIIDFFMPAEPRAKLLPMQTGTGKAVPLHTPVKIPGGWSTMGKIKEGDYVTAKDGSATKVTGVYPQGVTPAYRITFGDGRWVEACGEHLWKVFYVNTQPHKRWRVVNTLEVQRLISMPNPRVYVDLIDPEVTPDVYLPMDPYTLGVLLGDGHIGHGQVTVTTPDQFILEELRKVLPEDLQIVHRNRYSYGISQGLGASTLNKYVQILKGLGIYGKLSYEKYIPEMYMNGSIEQRLAVVQGLLDTDGTVDGCGTVSYCSTSEVMAKQVQYLIRSLGGIATLRSRQTYFTYKGEKKAGRPSYHLDIRFKVPSQLFRLPRKRDRTKDDGQYADILKLRVSSVVQVQDQETQCIAVDHPDKLFVVKDFIVTHNTFTTLAFMRRLQLRTVLVIKPMYMHQWAKDAIATFGLKKGDLVMVNGGKAMQTLINLAKADEDFDPKFIIISNATYRMFVRSYLDNPHTDMGYACKPWELFELLKAGLRVTDEYHQDFHLNFIIDTMTNVPRSIGLSATMVSDDRFMNDMYALVFPIQCHAPVPVHDRYIDIYSVMYRFLNPERIKFLNLMRQYSQSTFEKSIMKYPKVWKNYVDMLVDLSWHQFFKHGDYQPGMKLAIFCGMKEMCEAVTAACRLRYPDLAVRRFVDVDPDEHLAEADIICTTLQSCGTAKDIPGLAVVISSIALSSKQANEQLVGRLRRLKGWPDITPRFIFMTNRDNPKHLAYHQAKKEKLDGKVREFNTLVSTFII